MDLKEFIETTITQIVEGINSANTKITDSGAVITQRNVRPNSGNELTALNNNTGDLINLIAFDVAITVSEKDSANGSAGIKIVGINLGGALKNETTNQSLSRIKFIIPLSL